MVAKGSFVGVELPFSARAAAVLAQSSTVAPRELGEQPTSGGSRPGPVNAVPGLRSPGVLPVGLRIETIERKPAAELSVEVEFGAAPPA